MTFVLPAKRSREKESEQWGGQQEGYKNKKVQGTSKEIKIRKRSSSLGDRKAILQKKLQVKNIPRG